MGRKLSFKQMRAGTVVIGGGHVGTVDRETELTELDFRKLALERADRFSRVPDHEGRDPGALLGGGRGLHARRHTLYWSSKAAPNVFHSLASAATASSSARVGSITAQLVTHGKTNLPIEPFRIDRFAGQDARVPAH